MTLSFAAWKQVKVSSTTHEAAVVRPKVLAKSEPVSPALVASLIHPHPEARVSLVQFSPDGKRLLAAAHHSAAVPVWDVARRQVIRTVEASLGPSERSGQALVSPDWKSLYVPVCSHKVRAAEKDGQRVSHVAFRGELRCWDLATGEARPPVMSPEGHAVTHAWPAPAGGLLVCIEMASGELGTPPAVKTVLLTPKTGRRRVLVEGHGTPHFSRDGQFVLVTTSDRKGSKSFVRRFELPGGKETAKFEWDTKGRPTAQALSPDGRTFAAVTFGPKGERPEVRFLDAKTFAPRGRYTGEPGTAEINLTQVGFTPDGARAYILVPGAVQLWDTAAQKVVRTVKLGRLPLAYAHAVSPDGRRLVLAHLPTHDIRAAFNTRDPRELPQPRLSVIDLKDEGTPVRTLIAPHGHVTALAFAPDGRTLALGGTGAVHLFDLNNN